MNLKNKVRAKATERGKIEGLDKHPRLFDINNYYYNDLTEYSMLKCAFYICFKCKEPYFGGMEECGDVILK